jgi:hypothetical protein
MEELMRVIAAIALVAMLAGCETAPCGDETMAGIMAQNFVRRELRDPDSARFQRVQAIRSGADECVYSVTGRVASRNAFGGMVQSLFTVEMHKTRGENLWRAVGLTIF